MCNSKMIGAINSHNCRKWKLVKFGIFNTSFSWFIIYNSRPGSVEKNQNIGNSKALQNRLRERDKLESGKQIQNPKIGVLSNFIFGFRSHAFCFLGIVYCLILTLKCFHFRIHSCFQHEFKFAEFKVHWPVD